MKNSEKPAYPFDFGSGEDDWKETGLTKREIFTLAAMQGLCAKYGIKSGRLQYSEPARHAVQLAKATLAELEKESGAGNE